ncbi:23S rRNA methyltransferase [Streptomyces sp. NBC_00249]|uniref:putative RNA methyltransferase n=1 Tax=Streptomyces sp. NBC_00249 TaxID=2975690 RepID=UPI002257A740|nr:23S rRNA methyltransferase [Streptomyces sp. NBC_00249]MCX5192909.1 23S rRNA methyltransferase [Streptomyces sp. NBC_00249]
MLNGVVRYLACPHCGASLTLGDHVLHCPSGHSFDIAKQGYVNLLPGATKLSADTKEMVEARDAFLSAGHYAPVMEALVDLARRTADPAVPGCVVDIGGGTGHYHAKVMDAFPDADGLLLDISKFAVRRAAKAHPRIGAAVTDAWQTLPLQDGAAAMVINTFAPRNGPELHRILHPRGVLLVVTPLPDHLQELIGTLGLLKVEEGKESRLAEQLAPHFSPVATEQLTRTVALDHEALAQLVGMGPNAWHRDAQKDYETIRQLPTPSEVTLSVRLSAYRLSQ